MIKKLYGSAYMAGGVILTLGLILLGEHITSDARILAGMVFTSPYWLQYYMTIVKGNDDISYQRYKSLSASASQKGMELLSEYESCDHRFPYSNIDCECNLCGAPSKIYRKKL